MPVEPQRKTPIDGANRPHQVVSPLNLKTWQGEMATWALADHILKVIPKSAKVVFENDKVRVIEMTMKKGQKIPMHSHNRGLSYSLNAGKIRSTGEDGRSRVVDVRRGETSWSDVDGLETHAVENLGGVLRELSIEFKG
jgi:hypothetical protein